MKKEILDLMYNLSVGNINYEYASKQALILFDVMPSLFDFAKRRKLKGLTLRQIEEKTGISNAYLSQLENGKIKSPSYDVVKKLNDFYNEA